MDNVGYVNAEGGPLLIIAGAFVTAWSGIDGEDYARASQLFDAATPAEPEGGDIPVGTGRGVLWEMRGAGTADVFVDGRRRITIVRAWPNDPASDDAAAFLAELPVGTTTEIARLAVPDGVLAILWAAENGVAFRLPADLASGRPSGELAIEDSGLVVRTESGTFRCLHDEVASPLGIGRRLHVIAE